MSQKNNSGKWHILGKHKKQPFFPKQFGISFFFIIFAPTYNDEESLPRFWADFT